MDTHISTWGYSIALLFFLVSPLYGNEAIKEKTQGEHIDLEKKSKGISKSKKYALFGTIGTLVVVGVGLFIFKKNSLLGSNGNNNPATIVNSNNSKKSNLNTKNLTKNVKNNSSNNKPLLVTQISNEALKKNNPATIVNPNNSQKSNLNIKNLTTDVKNNSSNNKQSVATQISKEEIQAIYSQYSSTTNEALKGYNIVYERHKNTYKRAALYLDEISKEDGNSID